MSALILALLEPDSPSPVSPKVDPNEVTEAVEERPKFYRPQLKEVSRRALDTFSQPSNPKRVNRFGVILESFDPRLVAEVMRDLVSLIASLPPGHRLIVASPTSSPFWERLRKQLPIDFQDGQFDMVPVWKTYWIDKKPKAPEGVRPQFEKRIGTAVRRFQMKPARDTAVTPINPDAGRELPLGMSPANKPARHLGPVSVTPQLFLWSGRSPRPGEKVLVPDSEQILSIQRVNGLIAEIGPDRVATDLTGFVYNQPLDLWVRGERKN